MLAPTTSCEGGKVVIGKGEMEEWNQMAMSERALLNFYMHGLGL